MGARGKLDAEAVIERMKEAAGVSSDAALSRALGLSHGAVHHWRKKKKVPVEHVIELGNRCPGRPFQWLVAGEGHGEPRPLVVGGEPLRPLASPRDPGLAPAPYDGALADIALQETYNTLEGIFMERPANLVGFGWLVMGEYMKACSRYKTLMGSGKMTRDEVLAVMRDAAGIRGVRLRSLPRGAHGEADADDRE